MHASTGGVWAIILALTVTLWTTTWLRTATTTDALLVQPISRKGSRTPYYVVPRCSTKTTTRVLMSSPTGPRADAGRRRPSRRGGGNGGSPAASASAASPAGTSRRSTESAPSSRLKAQQRTAPFDGKMLASQQDSNLDAPHLDLENELGFSSPTLRCMTSGIRFHTRSGQDGAAGDPSSTALSDQGGAFAYLSLDDLFPDAPDLNFSKKFNSDAAFRHQLRMAIRQDIFDTTPFYATLSAKAASILLLPDSSLEGSWRIPDRVVGGEPRMKQTTVVLQQAFGAGEGSVSITGDELFRAIGTACGEKASTHWIDIVGVQDRAISHSWHLDAGASPGNCKTVLWGFPPEDDYVGSGIFSHVVPLSSQCLAGPDHPRMEPILFDGSVDERHIVRPTYEPGKEFLLYRDIDVLHSAPDVAYRTSVMRFM